MEIAIFTLTFFVAALLAGIMGFAVQRGATCTVAAVEQLVVEGSWQRFLSILEASLWVLVGLFFAHAIGLSMTLPPGYRSDAFTITGGSLLGLGAFVNRGCVFGSIARLGSGEWNYVATPIGFFAGCLLARALAVDRSADSVAFVMPESRVSALIAMLLVFGLGWRVVLALMNREERHRMSLRAHLHHAITRRVWEPGAATVVIGIAFVALFLLVGAWAYTDVLTELARGTRMSVLARVVLLVALFLGAFLGGWSAGLFRRVAFHTPGLLRCFSGGVLMGLGGGLVPGGNDGLLLIGMPLLWPYAWTAFAAMVMTIVIAMRIQR
jgi:hypothetical protein